MKWWRLMMTASFVKKKQKNKKHKWTSCIIAHWNVWSYLRQRSYFALLISCDLQISFSQKCFFCSLTDWQEIKRKQTWQTLLFFYKTKIISPLWLEGTSRFNVRLTPATKWKSCNDEFKRSSLIWIKLLSFKRNNNISAGPHLTFESRVFEIIKEFSRILPLSVISWMLKWKLLISKSSRLGKCLRTLSDVRDADEWTQTCFWWY